MIMCSRFFTVKQYSIIETCFELKNEKFKSENEKLLLSAFVYVIYVLMNIYDRDIMRN